MDMTKLLLDLCGKDSVGGMGGAKELIKSEASKYASVTELDDGSIVATVKGRTDRVLMIEAHYDQIGMVVTEVTEDGFVKCGAVGGLDIRMLPGTRVRIYGKKTVCGVFASVPPHLKKDAKKADELSALYIDTGYRTGLKDIVSVGDFAAFDVVPEEISEGVVTGASVDDRAGCAALLGVLESISSEGVPPITVKAVFADKEELASRGAVTAAYSIEPDEAIAVDVSFGDTPGVSPTDTGTVGGGAMIGLAPILDKKLCDDVTEAAKRSADYQFEVMGRRTGTDIDVIAVSRGGVRSGLISIPIRNMHTTAETVKVSDIKCVSDIITEYIMTYGEVCR